MTAWKLVPIDPTPEMLAALDDDTPYIVRRALDKSCYEVVFNPSDEWRVVIPNDMQTLFQGAEHAAHEEYDRRRRAWLYRAMLDAAPKPDLENSPAGLADAHSKSPSRPAMPKEAGDEGTS